MHSRGRRDETVQRGDCVRSEGRHDRVYVMPVHRIHVGVYESPPALSLSVIDGHVPRRINVALCASVCRPEGRRARRGPLRRLQTEA